MCYNKTRFQQLFNDYSPMWCTYAFLSNVLGITNFKKMRLPGKHKKRINITSEKNFEGCNVEILISVAAISILC